jgi:lipid-binding SYLF domain-containing protein
MIKSMIPIVAVAAAALQLVGCGASTMSARVTDAVDTINTLNASAEKPTSEDMKNVKGVVIMHTAQGGLGIGGEGGGGVVMKAIGRGWGAPFAMDVAAGTIGLQIGGQSKHFLIVFYDESAAAHRPVTRAPRARSTSHSSQARASTAGCSSAG